MLDSGAEREGAQWGMDSKGKEKGKGKDSVERHDAGQSPDSQEAVWRLPFGSQPAQDGVACRERGLFPEPLEATLTLRILRV